MIVDLNADPACWSWEVPPLPQPNGHHSLRAWHRQRCAICGTVRPDPALPAQIGYERRPISVGLYEDHDHSTGETRGYLCPTCNTAEGRSQAPVFVRYRQRPPAQILGLMVRKGHGVHPATAAAERDWENALSSLEMAVRWGRTDPGLAMTPLMTAALRVGLTWEEWHGQDPIVDGRWRMRCGLERTDTAHADYVRAQLAEVAVGGRRYVSRRRDAQRARLAALTS